MNAIRGNSRRIAHGSLLLCAAFCLAASGAARSEAAASKPSSAPARPALVRDAPPIPMPAVEVRAHRIFDFEAPDRPAFRIGAVTGRLYGLGDTDPSVPPGALPYDGAAAAASAASAAEENTLSGAGLDVMTARPESAFLEVGQVTLRNPPDVLPTTGIGDTRWWTETGIRIRF